MFCQKCGRKIKPNTSKCPGCGRPLDTNEYCGGFWDLFEKPEIDPRQYPKGNSDKESHPKRDPGKENPEDSRQKESVRRESHDTGQVKKQKGNMNRILLIVSAVIMVLLLLTGIVQGVNLKKLRKENDALNTKITKLERALKDARDAELEDVRSKVSTDESQTEASQTGGTEASQPDGPEASPEGSTEAAPEGQSETVQDGASLPGEDVSNSASEEGTNGSTGNFREDRNKNNNYENLPPNHNL